jgi:C-methyltransferase
MTTSQITPTRRLDPVPPLFVYRLILGVRNALVRLVRRMVPARVALFEQFTGVWLTQMIYAAAHLKVADHLADGPKTADELAVAVGAHGDSLARLLRSLTSVGIFARRRDGRFELNRMGETLRSDRPDSLRDIVLFLGSKHSMLAWASFADAVRTGKNGFEIAHGKPVFEYLAEHPADEAVFQGGMVSMTELDAPAIVRGYDYSRFSSICDVGGGRGLLLAAVLSENPELKGVLLDVASVIATSPAVFRAWGTGDRASAVAGDFFTEVPAGCDAYILKEILHDWDDTAVQKILAVCREAMRPGAKLLVVEMVVVDDDAPHPGKLLDMEMLDTTKEGRQRTAEELGALFAGAGFRLDRVVALPAAPSIVEGTAV